VGEVLTTRVVIADADQASTEPPDAQVSWVVAPTLRTFRTVPLKEPYLK
jgi:hypothetical protein